MGLESSPKSLPRDSVYPSVKWEGEASVLSPKQQDDGVGTGESASHFLAGELGSFALPCKLWSVGKNQMQCTNCAKCKYRFDVIVTKRKGEDGYKVSSSVLGG